MFSAIAAGVLLPSSTAFADDEQEVCNKQWLWWGVAPLTPQCPSLAQTTPMTLGTYYCVGVAGQGTSGHIARYCGLLGEDDGDPDDCGSRAGNPINLVGKTKIQVEQDYQGADPFPLAFSRYYAYPNGASDRAYYGSRSIGKGWRHNYSRNIHIRSQLILATRPDGKERYFKRLPDDSAEALSNSLDRLAPIKEMGELVGWEFRAEGGSEREIYGVHGKLVRIEHTSGAAHILHYANPPTEWDAQLIAVEHSISGRKIQFSLTPFTITIEALTTPDGSIITYTRNAEDRLTSVHYPFADGTGTSRQYIYGEPDFAPSDVRDQSDALTGIIDENGIRYATFRYDSLRRPIGSEHAGGADAVSITYGVDGSIDVLEPTGGTRTVVHSSHPGRKRVQSSSTMAGTCSAGTQFFHTELGDIRESRDGNGNGKCFVRSSDRRLVTKSLEGLAPNEQCPEDLMTYTPPLETLHRLTTQEWHPSFDLPVGIARPRHVTRYVYHGMPDPSQSGALAQCVKGSSSSNYFAAVCAVLDYETEDDSGSLGFAAPSLLSREQRFQYSSDLKLLESDGPRVDVSDVTTYAYYAATDETGCHQATGPCHRRGDLHTITNALGHVTTQARYDRSGRLTRSIDANGVVTELNYHARGWLLSRTVKGATATEDATTTFAYTASGEVQRITQADGSYLVYGYDDAHRLTSVTDALGNRIDYTLNSAGNRAAETTRDPQGAVTRQLSRVYNQLGRLSEQRDAQLRAYVFEYDANGNTTASTDPLNVRSEQHFDPLNRLQQSLQDVAGINAKTEYRYDALDRLSKVIDPKNLHTDYSYNGLGDLTQLSSPDTGLTGYAVDAAGNRFTQTDARRVKVGMQYDALNRLTRQSNSADAEVIVYRYDGAGLPNGLCNGDFSRGRLSQIEDSLGTLSYCYDRRGNVVAKHREGSAKAGPAASASWSINYRYTLADQLAALQYPDGETALYHRDAAGRVRAMDYLDAKGLSTPLISQVEYAPFGPVSRLVYANGSQWIRALDADYRIDRITAPGIDYDFSLDAVGNITGITQGASSRSFDYDRLYRLTAMKQGSTVLEGFGYDATGNRTSASLGGVTQNYVYAPSSHHLQSVAGEPRSYTAAGNTADIGGQSLEYSGFNRLITIPGQRGPRQRNAYNGRGEREYRESYYHPRHFGYDESGRLLFEAAGELGVPAEALTQRILWLDDQPIAIKNSSGAYAGELLYVQADHLGSPRVVTRPAAGNAVVWRWALEGSAFGQHAAEGDPDSDGVVLEFGLRYPGQYFDSVTGWHYNYFRDYEPGVGRYVQSDPIGIFGGIATYSYAQAAPLRYVDPDGKRAVPPCSGANGRVVCDGNGGFKAEVCNSDRCTRSCTWAHELQHVQDLQVFAPNRCQNKKAGDSPYQAHDDYSGLEDKIECRGSSASIRCAEDKLGNVSSCTDPDCESSLKSYRNWHIEIRRRRNCDSRGL
jgi:RHS repeat-associated protein